MATFPGLYVNKASSTTASAVKVTDSTISLQSGDGAKFPASGPYPIYVGNDGTTFERMMVLSRSGDTLTVMRGQQGGQPDQSYVQAFASGASVYLQHHDAAGDYFGVGSIVNGSYAPSTLSPVGNTAVATGAAGTIATAGIVVSKVNPAADRTGCILAAGTKDGQLCIVVNVSAAHSVTFDVAGTSNVADGVSSSVAALTAVPFVWESVTALWYRVI